VVRPHGLRHAAITAALDAGLDVRRVAKFSRHRDLRTLTVYDDNRQDLAGVVAAVVAGVA
jgi:integrase/recombinase XerC